MSARFCIYVFHPLRWSMTNAVISQLTQFSSMNHLDWSDPSKRVSLFFSHRKKMKAELPFTIPGFKNQIFGENLQNKAKLSVYELRYLKKLNNLP